MKFRTDPDQLVIPDSRNATEGERIFQAIAATGVIDWDRNRNNTAHA